MPDSAASMKAVVDFVCAEEDCGHTVQFDLMSLKAAKGLASCGNCHRPYQFEQAFLDKLEKLRCLILAVQDAGDILDECNVSVTTPAGEVKIPYRLLLTRLNTLISLEAGGKTMDFNFRVEPLNDATFK